MLLSFAATVTLVTLLALYWLVQHLVSLQLAALRIVEGLKVQENLLKPVASTIRQLHAKGGFEDELLRSCTSWLSGTSSFADLVAEPEDDWLYPGGYWDHWGSSIRRRIGSYRDYGYDYGYHYDYDLDYGSLVGGRRGGQSGLRRLFRNVTRALEASLKQQCKGAGPVGERWRIPHVVHQTWKTSKVPAKYAQHLASWRRLHPHWRFEFWDDRRSRALIAERFPEYLQEYDRMSGIKRADVARIVVLHAFGGVYADIDVEATRSLDDLLLAASSTRVGVLLGEENFVHSVLLEQRSTWLVSNAVMAGSRGHPFWALVLHEVFRNMWCGEDPVECTGPRLVDRLSWDYMRRNPACGANGCIARLPFDYFSPNIALWNAPAMIRECSSEFAGSWYYGRDRKRIRQRACQSLQKALQSPSSLQSERTYAVHHWQCSWCRQDSTMQRTVPLCHIEWRVGNESLLSS